MNKPFLLILLLVISLLSASNSNCQNKHQHSIDSLLMEVAQFNSSTLEHKVHKLSISKKLWKYNRLVSDSLLEETILNLDIERYPSILAKGYYMKANRMIIRRVKLDRSLDLLYSADSIAAVIDMPPSFKLLVVNKIGSNLRWQRRFRESLVYYTQAAEIAESMNDSTQMATAYIRAGIQAVSTEDYYKAIDFYLKSLSIKGPHHERVFSNLPNVYRKIENWSKVIEYGKRGVAYSKSTNNIRGEVFSLVHVGYGALKIKDYPLAESSLQTAWDFCIKYQTRARASIILSSLIKVAVEQGQYKKALTYEKDITAFSKKLDNPSIYTYLGLAHLGLGNPEKAENLAQKALKINAQVKRIPFDMTLYRMEANDCLQKALLLQGRYKEAYEAQSKYIAAKDTVKGKNTILNISSALNQQELAQQDAIFNLEKEQKNKLHAEKESKFIIAGLLGLSLLLVSLFAYYKLRQKQEKIVSQNALISQALKDKDILLREIHHRVKNNLQLISSLLTLQGRSIDDEMAKEAIREGQSRVRSMALIHQDLYNKENLTGIGVQTYLEKLCKELFQTYKVAEDQVELSLDIQDIELDVDTVVPLGLIINELITNSLKYAFSVHKKGLLEISLSEVNQELILIVEDNGRGFDQNNTRSESFGSTLISALTAQLGGELAIRSEKGTMIEISFKDYKVNN